MTTQAHMMTSTGRAATAAGLAFSFSAVRLRPLIAVVVASAVLLGVTLGGVIVPADVHLVVLLVAVPALTAAADNTCTTVSMTALACLGVVAVDVDDGLPSSPILPIDVLGLLVVCVLVLVFRRMRDVDHRTLRAVRSVSETAQGRCCPLALSCGRPGNRHGLSLGRRPRTHRRRRVRRRTCRPHGPDVDR